MKICRICGMHYNEDNTFTLGRITITIIDKDFDYCSFKCFKKGKHGKFVTDIVKKHLQLKLINNAK